MDWLSPLLLSYEVTMRIGGEEEMKEGSPCPACGYRLRKFAEDDCYVELLCVQCEVVHVEGRPCAECKFYADADCRKEVRVSA